MSDEWDAKAREIWGDMHTPIGLDIIANILREAYQRGRNEADTAAERRGIEQAIQQIGAIASGYESDTVDSFVEQVRALAQPAGASDREGRSALDDAEDDAQSAWEGSRP